MKVTLSLVLVLLLAGPATAQVNVENLETREGLVYEKGASTPFSGRLIRHHLDGTVQQSIAYENGIRHGETREWDANAMLRAVRNYDANRLDGTDLIYDHNGKLLRSAEHAEGVLNGATVWFYPDGTVKWETHFAVGKRTGTWSQYAADGSLSMQSTWRDGVRVARHDPHAEH